MSEGLEAGYPLMLVCYDPWRSCYLGKEALQVGQEQAAQSAAWWPCAYAASALAAACAAAAAVEVSALC